MEANNSLAFSTKLTNKLMQNGFKKPSDIKVLSKDPSSELFAELLRVVAQEACTRAAQQAHKEGSSVCDIEHVEKILPQLTMDF